MGQHFEKLQPLTRVHLSVGIDDFLLRAPFAKPRRARKGGGDT